MPEIRFHRQPVRKEGGFHPVVVDEESYSARDLQVKGEYCRGYPSLGPCCLLNWHAKLLCHRCVLLYV